MHLISHACFAKDIYEQQKYHGIIDSVIYPKMFSHHHVIKNGPQTSLSTRWNTDRFHTIER